MRIDPIALAIELVFERLRAVFLEGLDIVHALACGLRYDKFAFNRVEKLLRVPKRNNLQLPVDHIATKLNEIYP